MSHFDLELIDINENVENFSFERLSKQNLDKVLRSFKEKDIYIEFDCLQGSIVLERQFFRGLMYTPHIEKNKSIMKENLESAEEVAKIEVIKNKPKVKVSLKES
jgi:hypothetical protein